MDRIRTRVFCLADTHGRGLETIPQYRFDVVLHCGDLTTASELTEFRSAIEFLKSLDAPLKLVIPGNHDATLDPDYCRSMALDSDEETYGPRGDAWQLFQDARESGIMLLSTGIHRLRLENGALLTIYANPYTPSAVCDKGFQYSPGLGFWHFLDLDEPVDVVMSHGPPHGILDWNYDACSAGCPHLLETIARTRPLLHAFGHVHEDWGAKYVVWEENSGCYRMHPARSSRIRKRMDFANMGREGERQRQLCLQRGYEFTRHCHDDEMPLDGRRNATLFVNAAVEGSSRRRRRQTPWVVELELPAA